LTVLKLHVVYNNPIPTHVLTLVHSQDLVIQFYTRQLNGFVHKHLMDLLTCGFGHWLVFSGVCYGCLVLYCVQGTLNCHAWWSSNGPLSIVIHTHIYSYTHVHTSTLFKFGFQQQDRRDVLSGVCSLYDCISALGNIPSGIHLQQLGYIWVPHLNQLFPNSVLNIFLFWVPVWVPACCFKWQKFTVCL